MAKILSMIGKTAMHLVVSTFVAGLDPISQKLIKGMKYRDISFTKEERKKFYEYLKQSSTPIGNLKRERGIDVSVLPIKGNSNFIIVEFSFLVENSKYKNRATASLAQFKKKYLNTSQRDSFNGTTPFYFVLAKDISKKVNSNFIFEDNIALTKFNKYEVARYVFPIIWCISANPNISSFENSLTKKKFFNGNKLFNQYKCILPRKIVENIDKTNPPSSPKEIFDDYVIPEFLNTILENKNSASPDPIPSGILTMKTNELSVFVHRLAGEIVKQLKQTNFNYVASYNNFDISYNSGVNLLLAKTVGNIKVGVYRNSSTKIFEVRVSHKDHPNINQLSAVVKFNIPKDQASFVVLDNSNKIESEKILTISDSITEIMAATPESIATFMIKNAPPSTSYLIHLITLKYFV